MMGEKGFDFDDVLPNLSCCYCEPNKAVIKVSLSFTEFPVSLEHPSVTSGHTYLYNSKKSENAPSLTSPNFPEGWNHQWYIYFQSSNPGLCQVFCPTYHEDSPEALFSLNFRNDLSPVTFKWPAGSKTGYSVTLPVTTYKHLMKNRSLTVHVTLTILLAGKYSHLAEIRLKPLNDEFKVLLENQTGSDVSIISTNGKLAAHWAVLAARSPFFSAKLTNPQKKRRNLAGSAVLSSVKLDMTSETAGKMLEFMYTDKVKIDKVEEGQALLKAGHEFDIRGLKIIAEQFLCQLITKENALSLLILSHLYAAPLLKRKALKILWNNPTSATKSVNYLKLLSYPELNAELLEFRG